MTPRRQSESEVPSKRCRDIRRRLLAWYEKNRRDLPWRRRAGDAYAQWVAEVMLQQTRVPTVIEYYERFLRRFPDMTRLARADHGTVLKYWAGLGYYRRILHLHEACRRLHREGRTIPRTTAGLRELPGVGPYMSNAIASIAFGEPVAAVDGNVARVIARLFGVDRDTASARGRAEIQAIADRLLPADRAGEFNQAWMDLGSLVCTPAGPSCGACPLRNHCVARRTGRAEELPVRVAGRRASRPQVRALAVVLERDGRILARRRPLRGLWSGLWEVPTEERNGEATALRMALALARSEGLRVHGKPRRVGMVRHELTHRSMEFEVFIAAVRRANGLVKDERRTGGQAASDTLSNAGAVFDGMPRRWVTPGAFARLGVSTAQRRIVALAFGDERRDQGLDYLATTSAGAR